MKFDVLDSEGSVAGARHYQRALWLIWLVAALLIGVICWYVSTVTAQDRERQIKTAANDLGNLTRVTQEHADRTFRSADQVIRFVQEGYLKRGNSLDLQDLTRRGVIDAEIFNQVGIIDSKGIYVLANRPVSGKLDLSDREHFRVHVAQDTGKLWISKPVVGRATKRWSIQLTRRINRADGSFGGVVVVSIDPAYFTQFYRELKLGHEGVMGLIGMDGVARARRAGDKEEFGTAVGDAPLIKAIGKGEFVGGYTRRSSVDGVVRQYHYRKIPSYDLAVVAGIDMQDLLVKHYQARTALWQQAALLIFLTCALAGALARYLVSIRRVMIARLASQRQVQERTEQLDAIFSLSPDGFVSFDHDKRVSYVNPAFSNLTGSTDIDLKGLDERDFSSWLALRCVGGRRFPGFSALQTEAHKAGLPALNTALKHQLIEIAGQHRRVLQIELRTQSGAAVSQILYLRDVTIEAEVDVMKSEFIAVAAHELRTPMTSILGYTEILLETDNDAAAQREFLNIILNQSNLMVHILDDLLDLARIEARRGQEFRSVMLSVNEFIHETVKLLPLAPERNSPILILPAESFFVMGDARKLPQALLNVLTNAYKYSAVGSEVEVRARLMTDVDGKSMVCIDVTDRGIGMTSEEMSQVFVRFYRADKSGKYPGTGLGMSIVKEVMDLHGGQVHIDSTPSKGSCFSLCLPSV